MAYKRTTKKTGRNSKQSVTYNTKAPSTYSNSSTSNGVTYTHTSKGGKYYTTRTQRFANGYVERKRITSSSTKKVARPKSGAKKNSSGSSALAWIVFFGIIGLIALITG